MARCTKVDIINGLSKKPAILSVAIIQHGEEFSLVSNFYDDLCHLEEGGANWSDISDSARILATLVLCDSYSKQAASSS